MLEEMVDVDSGLPGLLLDTVIDQALIRLTAAKAVLKWVAIQANKWRCSSGWQFRQTSAGLSVGPQPRPSCA